MSTEIASPPAKKRLGPVPPYYRARKRLTIHTADGKARIFKPGQVVPTKIVESWTRYEAWVRSGHLELVEA